MKTTITGIDPAKCASDVHGVTEHRRGVSKKVLELDQTLTFFAKPASASAGKGGLR